MKHRIVSFGEILWDNFKDGKKPGGAPMNVALHLHRQGAESLLISSAGKDANGSELLDYLESQGLPVSLIQEHPLLPTGLVEVEVDAEGLARYEIKAPVAWDEIKFTPELQKAVSEADVLVFGSLACRNETSRKTLLELLPYAKFRIFDMNLRPPHFEDTVIEHLMQNCDFLKINEDELEWLQPRYAEDGDAGLDWLLGFAQKYDIELICITLGGKGARVIYNGKIYEHGGFKVKVADTVGAGDAFLATFIISLLRDNDIKGCLERACATGALVASRSGANPEYEVGEIEGMIK